MSTTPVIVTNLTDAQIQFESRSPGNDNDPDFHSDFFAQNSTLNVDLNPTHDRIAVSNGGDVRKQIDISAHQGRPLVVVATGSVNTELFITVIQLVVPTVEPELSPIAVNI